MWGGCPMTGKVKNHGWQLISTNTGAIDWDYMQYDELCAIAVWGNNNAIRVSVVVPTEILDNTAFGYICGKNDHSVRIDLSKTRAVITEWSYGGTNYASSSNLRMFGRKY